MTQDKVPYSPIFVEENPIFKKAYIAAPSAKGDYDLVYDIAEEVAFLSDKPMYDDFCGTEFRYRFGHLLAETLKNFDPENDVLVYYGDQMIISIAIFYLAQKFEKINIGRWSKWESAYVVRQIDTKLFI